jgi:hypothetical protein
MVYLLLAFGFDMHKPPGVSIMYSYRICNNFGQFDGWATTKKNMILCALNSGRSSTNHKFGETCDIL